MRSVGQHHGNLRPALLAAALAAVAEGPVSALSLRGVARRAGVSPAAVYHHFADKRALLGAVAEEGFRDLHDVLASFVEEADPMTRLRRMSSAYVRFAVAHAAHYQVMWDPELGADPGEPSSLDATARAAFGLLVDAVGRVAKAEPDEVRRRAVMAWSLAHGAVLLAVHRLPERLDPRLDPDGLADAVGDAVVGLSQVSSAP